MFHHHPFSFRGEGVFYCMSRTTHLDDKRKNSLMTVQVESVRVRACVRNFIWHLPGCQDHVVMQTSLISNSRTLCVQTRHCDYHKHLFTESTHFFKLVRSFDHKPSEIGSKCAGTKMKESVQGNEEPDNWFKEWKEIISSDLGSPSDMQLRYKLSWVTVTSWHIKSRG